MRANLNETLEVLRTSVSFSYWAFFNANMNSFWFCVFLSIFEICGYAFALCIFRVVLFVLPIFWALLSEIQNSRKGFSRVAAFESLW